MDKNKFKVFKSGLTDEDREAIAKKESVEAVFKNEKGKVSNTVNTAGFKLIIDKIVAETEVRKLNLLRCKPKDLERLQQEINIRMEFIHS